MIGGGDSFYLKFLDQTDRVGAKSPIFDLFPRSDSAVTPSEKKLQLTLIGWLKTESVRNLNNKLR